MPFIPEAKNVCLVFPDYRLSRLVLALLKKLKTENQKSKAGF
jgi:hypothetical protein